MRQIRNKRYGAERLRVDEAAFENCEFHGTTLVIAGGAMPIFKNSEFFGIDIDFEDGALETVKFLRMLVLMGGEDMVFAHFRLAARAKN